MKKLLIIFTLLVSGTALADEVNYEQAINTEEKNVLLIIGTEWCGACNNLKKDLSNLDLKNYDFCVIDAEKRKDLVKKYEIRSYPTSIILKNKEVISKKTGYKKSEYKNWLDKNREEFKKEAQKPNGGCKNCSPNCECNKGKCNENCKCSPSCTCKETSICKCNSFFCYSCWVRFFQGAQ